MPLATLGRFGIGGLLVTDGGSLLTAPQRSTLATTTPIAGSTTPFEMLAADPARLGATIINYSAGTLYLLLGSGTVSSTFYTARLSASAYLEIPYAFRGRVSGLLSSSGTVLITEFRP